MATVKNRNFKTGKLLLFCMIFIILFSVPVIAGTAEFIRDDARILEEQQAREILIEKDIKSKEGSTRLTADGIEYKRLEDMDWYTPTQYGEYEISKNKWYNVLGMFKEKVVKKVTLEQNTESCAMNCEAVKEFILYEKGVLIEDIKFLRYYDNLGWLPWNSYSGWKLELLDGQKEVEQEVYETVCNGKDEEDCEEVLVGKEKILVDNWIELKVGEQKDELD